MDFAPFVFGWMARHTCTTTCFFFEEFPTMPGTVGFNFADAAVMVKEEFEPAFYRTFQRNNVFMELLKPTEEKYAEKDI